jgi:DNA-binding response OmpR family regulator
MTAENKSHAGERAGPTRQGSAYPPRRILVVDDDMDNRQVIQETLILSGYETDFAADGAAGWDAVQVKHYDLLITDNFMPKVTGVEMVGMLRSQNPTLPIIMATAAVPTEELKRYPWLEIDAFLIKPYSVGNMLRTVRRVLRNADCANSATKLLACPDAIDNQLQRMQEADSQLLEQPTHPPHRILVAEDDLTICRLNTDVLRQSGYHVDAAEDGAVAWDTLQRSRYDLLVTDNDMPKMSGVELLKMLRASSMTLPVIMVTGKFPQEEFNRHPWIQPDALLLKPFSFEDLLGTVREVLQKTNGARGTFAATPDLQTEWCGDGWRD